MRFTVLRMVVAVGITAFVIAFEKGVFDLATFGAQEVIRLNSWAYEMWVVLDEATAVIPYGL